MIIKTEKNKIIVGFPLTQPKRAWKLRVDGKKSAAKIIGHQIQNEHYLEWMVDYSELRDILCCLKKIDEKSFINILKEFNKAQPEVDTPEKVRPREPKQIGNIVIEMQMLGKQYKPSEVFPYIFVLFNLGYEKALENLYIIDKEGNKINKSIGRIIKCGDILIWLPINKQISSIVTEFAYLSGEHKRRAQKDIFDVI